MFISNSEYTPQILPVVDTVDQPLWSVMIPTYNCASYLKQTLESVLTQDPGPKIMQIKVIDDCSTKDDPETVVQEVGQGRVQFYRQPTNLGAITTFNTCIQHSTGKFVHILHGDDLVKDGFYRSLERPLLDNPEIGAAFCRQIYIDEQSRQKLITRSEQSYSGVLPNALELLAVSNRIPPPAIVIKREVYENLGGYDLRLFHAADWEMWVRIAAHYLIWYELNPLAMYRVHTASHTARLFQTGANMQNRRKCIEIYRNYLPPQCANRLTRKALHYSVMYGLRLAFDFLRLGYGRLSLVQLREAILCLWQLFQPGYRVTPS